MGGFGHRPVGPGLLVGGLAALGAEHPNRVPAGQPGKVDRGQEQAEGRAGGQVVEASREDINLLPAAVGAAYAGRVVGLVDAAGIGSPGPRPLSAKTAAVAS